MLKALLAIGATLRSAWLIELVGAVLIVAGVAVQWGRAAALIAAGAMLILKAFELESDG